MGSSTAQSRPEKGSRPGSVDRRDTSCVVVVRLRRSCGNFTPCARARRWWFTVVIPLSRACPPPPPDRCMPLATVWRRLLQGGGRDRQSPAAGFVVDAMPARPFRWSSWLFNHVERPRVGRHAGLQMPADDNGCGHQVALPKTLRAFAVCPTSSSGRRCCGLLSRRSTRSITCQRFESS